MAKKTKDLIRGMTQAAPPRAAEPAPVQDSPPSPPPAAEASGSKAVTFWLDEETQKVFTRLRVLLATENVKSNDSLILRTALDLLPDDRRFVERLKELKKRDRRRARLQKAPQDSQQSMSL